MEYQFLHYGYLKDKDGLKFTIGNDTHYSYTTYGAFVTVTYKNTPIKGQLEIKKTGENLVIKDGKYTYKDKKLSGVTFEIYAEEDIKSADGNHLYYEKGTKVDTITTDKVNEWNSKTSVTKVSELDNDSNYQTDTQVSNIVSNATSSAVGSVMNTVNSSINNLQESKLDKTDFNTFKTNVSSVEYDESTKTLKLFNNI